MKPFIVLIMLILPCSIGWGQYDITLNSLIGRNDQRGIESRIRQTPAVVRLYAETVSGVRYYNLTVNTTNTEITIQTLNNELNSGPKQRSQSGNTTTVVYEKYSAYGRYVFKAFIQLKN